MKIVNGTVEEEKMRESNGSEMKKAYAKYSALVDTQFLSGLSAEEQRELSKLEELLTKYESQFYEPIIKKLKTFKDNLLSDDIEDDNNN